MVLATSIGGIALYAVLLMIVLTAIINTVGRGAQAARGRNKCRACGSRLKKVGASFAGTCSKCGTKQPWA